MAAGRSLSAPRGSDPGSRHTRSVVLWSAFGVAVYLGIFQLPFLFPPTHPSSSESYAAGFRNNVSEVVILLASLCVLANSWWGPQSKTAPLTAPKIAASTFLWIAAIYVAVLSVVALIVSPASDYFNADAGYFIHVVNNVVFDGSKPYTGFEYAYGPLLLYPAVWLYRIVGWTGISAVACYFLFAICAMVAGLYFLFWLIRELYPRFPQNKWLFMVIGITTLHVNLGVNESYFRYLIPFVALVFLRRVETVASAYRPLARSLFLAAYLAICACVTMLISPDVGLAFAAGATAYSLIRARFDSGAYAISLCGPALGALTAVSFFGSGFFHSVGTFSAGYLNLVIVPYPLLVAYLIGVIALAPLAVGASLRSGTRDGAILAGYYVCGLALAPGALGHCDFGHVFFNGMGMILLAFRRLAICPARVQNSCIALLGVLLLCFQFVWLNAARHELLNASFDTATTFIPAQTRARLAKAIPYLDREGKKLRKLKPAIPLEFPPALAGAKIAAPWDLDRPTDALLRRNGARKPEFFNGFANVAAPEAEDVKIRALGDARWALTPPAEPQLLPSRAFLREWFLFPLSYRQVRSPYPVGDRTWDFLRSHFQDAGKIGRYTLWKRNAIPPAPE